MVILMNDFAVFQLKWFYIEVINFRHIHQVCLSIAVEQLGSLWTDFHEL